MHLEYNMIYHDFSVTKNLDVFGLFELFMEWIVFLQKEKILSMPFARSVMSACRALFDILSSSLLYMQKTCDVAVKAILAKKNLRKKCINRDKM